jgi:hypothetical protein
MPPTRLVTHWVSNIFPYHFPGEAHGRVLPQQDKTLRAGHERKFAYRFASLPVFLCITNNSFAQLQKKIYFFTYTF